MSPHCPLPRPSKRRNRGCAFFPPSGTTVERHTRWPALAVQRRCASPGLTMADANLPWPSSLEATRRASCARPWAPWASSSTLPLDGSSSVVVRPVPGPRRPEEVDAGVTRSRPGARPGVVVASAGCPAVTGCTPGSARTGDLLPPPNVHRMSWSACPSIWWPIGLPQARPDPRSVRLAHLAGS